MRSIIGQYPSPLLLQYKNILVLADLLQLVRPYRYTHFAYMRLAEQQHEYARLANTAAYAERQFVIDDSLMVG